MGLLTLENLAIFSIFFFQCKKLFCVEAQHFPAGIMIKTNLLINFLRWGLHLVFFAKWFLRIFLLYLKIQTHFWSSKIIFLTLKLNVIKPILVRSALCTVWLKLAHRCSDEMKMQNWYNNERQRTHSIQKKNLTLPPAPVSLKLNAWLHVRDQILGWNQYGCIEITYLVYQ